MALLRTVIEGGEFMSVRRLTRKLFLVSGVLLLALSRSLLSCYSFVSGRISPRTDHDQGLTVRLSFDDPAFLLG